MSSLPSLLVLQHGKVINRLTGFDGLTINPKQPDEWSTHRLEEWLSRSGAIDYIPPSADEVREEMERMGLSSLSSSSRNKGTIYRGGIGIYNEDI